jgi:integrase
MFSKPLPRFVIAKRLASGATGFYFHLPAVYRKLECPVLNEPLGTDYQVACGENGDGGRAAIRNALFDEWNGARKGESPVSQRIGSFGSVDWLFREYKASKAYLEKVAPRSRPDYERTMQLVTDIVTKKGDRIGDRRIRAISPVSADKIYEIICKGPRGLRPRQGEKAVALCRRAWRVVHRLHPNQFNRDVPNPWEGVTKPRRIKATKAAVTRDQVYAFASGCIERGETEAAAAAVICFEWLQRPENVLSGYLRWSDYRNNDWPSAIKIVHHKTGVEVWHPLEETAEGTTVKFYEAAEAVLAKLARRGLPMILREVRPGVSKPFSFGGMQKIVQKMRAEIGLPKTFTLDACRHGGMTELEEAELTDGQGRALSAHKSQQAYEGYAKRTMERALSATRKRHAHRHVNAPGTNIQNGQQNGVQNADADQKFSAAK